MIIYKIYKDDNVLNEAKGNLPYNKFVEVMNQLGFDKIREAKGSSKVFTMSKYGDKSAVTIHIHNNGAEVHPDGLKEVAKVLKKIGWFKNPKNYNMFPFEDWKISRKDIEVDTTEQDIADANEKYKDASVYNVFHEKNSVYALVTKDGCNLCRSEEDRRPLLPDWYDEFGRDRDTGEIPCLKRENWTDYKTEVFPILRSGKLDVDNMIVESLRYGK